MSDLAGRLIRGYELRELLGVGGFGEVYRAYQSTVGREVAIKVILPDYANQMEFIRRFETEAQLVARLEHPFIVPLFDYWRDPDGAYLVMRLFRGGNLKSILDKRRLTNEEALAIIDQIAGALTVAHRNNVIHRDLKPDNILLDEDGNAYLTDFGIAKRTGARGSKDEFAETRDDDDELAGSPGYMSPEQITSEEISPRTDIYSFGVIVYEMFTGQHPFFGLSTTELIFKHLQYPLPDLALFVPELPHALNNVIQRATAKDPADRYPDALALALDVREALSETGISLDDSFITSELEQIQTNPYKGLRPFEEADAMDFFGREALTAHLLGRLREAEGYYRFLAVVGPSGSGKSSVVKAGVIPALRWGEIEGSEAWFIVEFVPSQSPLEQLTSALTSLAITPFDIATTLKQSPRGLVEVAAALLPTRGELLLIIDQFEEVFTLVENERERTQFLDLIRVAATDPDSRLRIIVTLRADFYDRPLLYEGFGALMRTRTEVVLPLSTEELERAITAPAERVGLSVEPQLLAAVISDVSEEPGALPLLEYVLTEVYERREGNLLTLAGYQASGGALGALARRAEDIYSGMDAAQQAMTRQLFLRLVTLGEGTEDTRRRVGQSELMAFNTDTSVLETVRDWFGKYRLLSFDRDAITREPTLEVAHEALIREWQRLREWLSMSREDVRLQRNLAAASTEWVNSGKEGSFLLRGSRLSQFEEWAAATDLALTQGERDYLAASVLQRQQQDADEAERRAREALLERRARYRLRALAVVLALAFGGALILSMYAMTQSEIAHQERNNAQTQVAIAATAAQDAITQQLIAQNEAAIARSLALSANANQLESAGQHELALALALAANRLETPPDQAQRVLAEIAYAPGMIARVGDEFSGHSGSVSSVKFSPDGRYLLTGGDDSRAILWDAATREKVHTFAAHQLPVSGVAFTPDNLRVVTASWDSSLILWDIATGEPIRTFSGHRGIVRAVAVTPDGRYLLSGATDGAILWDINSGEIVHRYDSIHSVFSLAVSPDSETAVLGAEDSTLIAVDLTSGRTRFALIGHSSAVLSVAFSPDGVVAISGARDNTLIAWNMNSGNVVARLHQAGQGAGQGSLQAHTQPVNGIVYLNGGAQILTVSDDLTLRVWDARTYQVLRQFGAASGRGEHTARLTAVALHPDDKTIVTTSADRSIILWDVTGGARLRTYPAQDGSVLTAGFAPQVDNTVAIFTAADDGSLWVRDAGSGEVLQALQVPDGVGLLSSAQSPDGRVLAAGLDDHRILLWDAHTGEALGALSGHSSPITALVFSPDSTRLVSGADDSTLILWDVATQAQLMRLGDDTNGHIRRILSLAYSPDGRTILSGSFDRTLILWDAETGEPIRTLSGHTRRVLSISYHPEGRWALSGSDDNSIILWDLETGRLLRRFNVNGESVFAVRYSPDGRFALYGTEQGSLTLLDLEIGQVIRHLDASQSGVAVTTLAFAPDGLTALVGLRNGQVALWQTPNLAQLIAWVGQNRYVPVLTCEERDQYAITPLCEEEADDAALLPAAAETDG